MANIPVTQTTVDGSLNSVLHEELSNKRDDVTGIIQGNFQISNNVHGEGTKFISGTAEYPKAEPDLVFIKADGGENSTTMDASFISAGDLIFAACLYYAGVTPGLPSGFTNITGGQYSSYHGWRYAYKIATSTDASNGITVSNGNRSNLILNFRPKLGTTPTYTGGQFVGYNNRYSSYLTPVTTSVSVLIFLSQTVGAGMAGMNADPPNGFVDSNSILGTSTSGNKVTYSFRITEAGETVPQIRADIGSSNFRHGGILQFNV